MKSWPSDLSYALELYFSDEVALDLKDLAGDVKR